MKPQYRLFAFLIAGLSHFPIQGQILTATDLFNQVSERYATFNDYSAQVAISQGGSVMLGNLIYRSPNLVRIDFFEPRGQVIVSDGKTLTVYVPSYAVTFTQELGRGDNVSGLATGQGLRILRNNYSIAYADSPSPQPLQANSTEMVTKLRLTWKSSGEAFRQIDLAISENGLIRRITGVTVNYRTVQMDFTNIEPNKGIGAGRFQYEPPPNANRIHNYLFEPDA
jgi:outer membrane lipoprotein-sorting protein